MMRNVMFCLFLVLTPSAARPDSVVAVRTLRAMTVIGPEDVMLKQVDIPGAAQTLDEVIGRETRMALYAGHPVRSAALTEPAVVERNQIVPLIYAANGVQIITEGRSLSRAGFGETIRVMNLSSRATVSGRVAADGRVFVNP